MAIKTSSKENNKTKEAKPQDKKKEGIDKKQQKTATVIGVKTLAHEP